MASVLQERLSTVETEGDGMYYICVRSGIIQHI